MRLHRLEITAFGPFARTETVDFDVLGADGLFLLHGQTGAGKTTVLDAVAFALYGTVPGARKDGKRLLSDHAEQGSVPQVVLEATLGGRRLRIVRSPEFLRPKKRGTGFIKENAKASLTWVDGHGQNLTRLDEIGEAVNGLLGMSADQFFQVVLLPQGEFARFLRADSEERGILLERLFDTARFGDVEQWFAEQRRRLAAELEASTNEIDKMLGRVSQAAGVPEPMDGTRTPVEWADEVLTTARQNRTLAQGRVVVIEAAEQRASRALVDATATLDLQRRRTVALKQQARYRDGESGRLALRRSLANALAAGPIATAAADRRRASSVAERAAAHLDRIEGLLRVERFGTELVAALTWPPVDPVGSEERATVAQFVRSWTTEVARSTALLEKSREADALERQCQELRVDRDALSARLERLRTERERLPASIESAESRMHRATTAQAELPAAQERRRLAEEAVKSAAELDAARTALAEAVSVREDARTAQNAAKSHALDLRERRIDGMAAELAARLQPDEPCMVCGSIAHPNLAAVSASTVTKKQEAAAVAAERAASSALERATEATTDAERTVDLLTERTGNVGTAALLVARDAAAEAEQLCRTAAADAPPAAAEVRRLRAESDRIGENIAELTTARTVTDRRIVDATESASAIRAEVAQQFGDPESATATIAALENAITTAAQVHDARMEWAAAVDDVNSAHTRVRELVDSSGFDSVEDAAAAALTPARIEQIEQELRADEDLRVHAEHVLAEPAIGAVEGVPPVDLVPLENDCERLDALVKAAVSEAADARRRAEELERLTALLLTAIEQVAPQRATFDELAALADVVAGRGQNARKMSLRSYVLASRLEDVAESATERLRRMSSGRYEFVHSDEAGARGKRGGLGLDIRDDYTGVVRSAKTLSGGESFLASLALALGLADVVAAESGGVVLDTMFIDEGFGTLDAETLESVMGVLDELRAGGRVVGIVSHVDEMRHRIPSRLHVIRQRNGSTLEVIAAS